MLILKSLKEKLNLRACFLLLLFLLACGENPNVKKGKQFVEIGDFEKAAESFEAAIQEEPQNADAHYLLGLVYYDHLRDQRKAIKEYELAIKSGLSDAVEKFSVRADTFVAKNRWNDAATHLKMAIQADTSNANLYFRLGEVLSNRYANREMAKAFLKALELSEENELFEKICRIPQVEPMLRVHPIPSGYGYNFPPIYSPDEKTIIWVKDPQGQPSRSYSPPRMALYIMDLDGNNQIQLVKNASWDRPNAAVNSSKIINGYHIIDLETKESSYLDNGLGIGSSNAYLSPDGESFVFNGYKGKDQGIYLCNISNKKSTRLTTDTDYSPCFLPNGKEIVFIEQYDFKNRYASGKSIGIIKTNNKNRRTIFTAPEGKGIMRLWPTKDGRSIIFYYSYDGNPFMMDIDGKNLKELSTPSPISDITADGTKALMVHNGQICEFELNAREYTRDDLRKTLRNF